MSLSQSSLTAAPARKWRWPLLILLLFLLLILACSVWWGVTAAYHQQTFHPTGQILFECSPHMMMSRLCKVNADGSAYTIFDLPKYQSYWVLSWSWSPDGKNIAFLRDVSTITNSGTGVGLSLLKADGSGLIEFTNQFGNANDLSWSPDEKTLAFAKFDDSWSAEGIYTIQVDGSNLKQLSDFGVGPVWSPDGKQIAFINKKDGIYDSGIYVLNVDTGAHIQIADGIPATSLAWSPNGLQIAFSNYPYRDRDETLGLINADGSNRKQFKGNFSSPAWSPDGTKIAYICAYYILCMMNADGTGQTQLANNTLLGLISSLRAFSWSPDGQYIVYDYSTICPGCGPVAQLWIMKADGSQQTKLTDKSDGLSYPYDRNPVWRSAP